MGVERNENAKNTHNRVDFVFLLLVTAVVSLSYSHYGSNLENGTFNNTLYNSTLQAV